MPRVSKRKTAKRKPVKASVAKRKVSGAKSTQRAAPSKKQRANQTKFARLTQEAWDIAHEDGKKGKARRSIKAYFAEAKKRV